MPSIEQKVTRISERVTISTDNPNMKTVVAHVTQAFEMDNQGSETVMVVG